MKIEICDCTSVTIILSVAIIGIVFGAVSGCQKVEETNRKAIELGLVQSKSQQGGYWVKP